MVTAQLSTNDLTRILRGMSPREAASYMRSRTLHPAPRYIEPCIYDVKSFTSEDWWRVNTETKSCTCPSTRTCRHYWYVRFHQEFGPYEWGIRAQAAADRYERATGLDAVATLPPEGETFEDFRERKHWGAA